MCEKRFTSPWPVPRPLPETKGDLMLEQPLSEQIGVRCVLMRGGTSKGLFFHAADIPDAGIDRDRFLKRAMGTPDVMQGWAVRVW
jgi:hypothetical protein